MAGYRRELRHPPNLVGAVPGWRHALIVHDPRGVALRIQQEARRWRWADVAATCDRWVADQVAGYAEEVGKLVNALRDGERTRVSVQRSVLGLRLAMIAAVHHRLLVESENYLWDRVAQLLGPGWAGLQEVALTRGSSPAGARAALELYVRLAEDVEPILSGPNRAAVLWAIDQAHAAIGRGSSDA